jgi:FkbM family methyltransferase
MRNQGRMLKKPVQKLLLQMGLYGRLKTSSVYDMYWRVLRPSVIDARSQEVQFYRQVLKRLEEGGLVFDIGANQGYKTDIFLRLGAKVIAVDPDENNQRALRERFLRYRLVPKAVTVEGVALGDTNATQTMWIDAPGSAKNTLSSKWVDTLRHDESRFGESLEFRGTRTVRTTTLEELIAAHGTPVFIKIDVEGYEEHVLRGLRRAVPYVSFEVNLPEFAPEGLQCLHRLAALEPSGLFNYAAEVRAGMALSRWLPVGEFVPVFEAIREKSVDVFWRTVGD